MSAARDPFHVLALSHDASTVDVRRAFRRLARETHPDQGGSAVAFHQVRQAYGRLTDDLEGERQRWTEAARRRPTTPLRVLDPSVFPTCIVKISRGRDGRRRFVYDVSSRPSAWVPGDTAPEGGSCQERFSATSTSPAFGVWIVKVDAHRFRCVFGPHP
ncbi:J domain-containing protein [Rubrivirga sp.]|uniref:J domain-containing protein n=1 Tax=Rubrivirga sp. TaxID=1885344 RepID=UPI003C71BC3F